MTGVNDADGVFAAGARRLACVIIFLFIAYVVCEVVLRRIKVRVRRIEHGETHFVIGRPGFDAPRVGGASRRIWAHGVAGEESPRGREAPPTRGATNPGLPITK